MRHHHQHRPAAAVVQAIGEHVAGRGRPGEVHAGGVAGRRDAQHLGQPLAGNAQAVAERDQAFVAQPAHAHAQDFHAMARGRRCRMLAHPFGMRRQARAVRNRPVARLLGGPGSARFDRRQALPRASLLLRRHLQGGPRKRPARHRPARPTRPGPARPRLAHCGPGLLAAVHPRQVRRDVGLLGHSLRSTAPLRRAQGVEVVVAHLQRSMAWATAPHAPRPVPARSPDRPTPGAAAPTATELPNPRSRTGRRRPARALRRTTSCTSAATGSRIPARVRRPR